MMMAQDSSEMVPLFLGELATDIFVCGKSINLLKLCSPQVSPKPDKRNQGSPNFNPYAAVS